jgi:hypothetical protein
MSKKVYNKGNHACIALQIIFIISATHFFELFCAQPATTTKVLACIANNLDVNHFNKEITDYFLLLFPKHGMPILDKALYEKINTEIVFEKNLKYKEIEEFKTKYKITIYNLLLYILGETPPYPSCYWNWNTNKNKKEMSENKLYDEINPVKETIEYWLEKRPIVFNVIYQSKKQLKKNELDKKVYLLELIGNAIESLSKNYL